MRCPLVVSISLLVLVVSGCRERPPERDPNAKPPRAKDMLERVVQIQPELERVRQLKLTTPIVAERQTREQLGALYRGHIDKHAALVADVQRAYVALGLLPTDVNLGAVLAESYTSETAAYYSHATKKMVFVSDPENDASLEFFVSHELTHGLQDQNFDLATFMAEGKPDERYKDSDALLARRYLVEGDAMLAAIMHLVYAQTGVSELVGNARDRMRKELQRLTAGPLGKLYANMAATNGSASNEEMDRLGKLPPSVVVPLVDPYLHGALFVFEAYCLGGWKAVDGLYREPPTSTEQVLHPERLLRGRDQPRRVTIPTFPDYELVLSDVLGELMWTLYFERWAPDADRPAVNWGGDRFMVLRGNDSQLSILIAVVMDGPYDAKQFADTYTATLAKRFPDERINTEAARHWIIVEANEVFIFHGSDLELRDRFADETTFERKI